METKIIIYGQEDLKKSGGFKKKNGVVEMDKQHFFKYLKENNFKIQSDYIDTCGSIFLENGNLFKRFRCSHGNFIRGTSGICKEFI